MSSRSTKTLKMPKRMMYRWYICSNTPQWLSVQIGHDAILIITCNLLLYKKLTK